MSKKLGLSIRGGGAQGAAYTGVLQAFKDEGVQIDMMIGTSAGALAAGLFAHGVSPETILNAEKHLHVWSFFGFDSLRDKSIMSDDKMVDYIRGFTGETRLEELSLPVYVQVTEVNSGKEVVMESGDLATILTATSTMPPIMHPVTIDGAVYIDGGYSAAYNASFLRKKGADVVVGVTIDDEKMFKKEKHTTFDYLYMIVKNLHDLDLLHDQVDYLIDGLGNSEIGVLDFQKSTALYEKGYAIAKQKMNEIRSLIE